jgi:histidinol-phosphate aminotransferase
MVLRLDRNESPLDIAPDLKRSLCRQLEEVAFNRYCRPEEFGLTRAIASYAGVEPDWVFPGNGADEVIAVAVRALAGPGGRVVIPCPTFPMYGRTARWAGAGLVEVASPPPLFPLQPHLLAEAVRQGPSRSAGAGGTLAIICQPNNPTGYSCAVDLIANLLELPGNPVVAVDEAYFEISGVTVAPLLSRYPGLVVFRTLSKAFCMAGMRLGYALAHPDLVRTMNRFRLSFNVSVATQAVAMAVLQEPTRFLALGRQLREWTQGLHGQLSGMAGIVRVLPTETNFILFEPEKAAARVRDELVQQGIAVRYYADTPALQRYLRVSTGTPEENATFLKALAGVLASA